MTNEQNNEVKEAEVLTAAEMTDAIRVLMADNKNANAIREDLKNSQHQNERNIKLILDDLGNPRSRYERTPTRKLAVAAYQQAHGFISTEDLEEHQIIKDLGEELEKYVGQVNNKFTHLRRQIEAIPEPKTMHELLSSNWIWKELVKKVEELDSNIDHARQSRLSLVKDYNDFRNTYNDNNHPTREEFDESILDVEEYKIRFNDLIHFFLGVFATMKMEPIVKAIETYKFNLKKEVEKDEEPTGTS